MKHFLQSFYARIAALFLSLMVLLSFILMLLSMRSLTRFVNETDQKLNRTLAPTLAPVFEDLLRDRGLSSSAMDQHGPALPSRMTVYVLSLQGRLRAHYPASQELNMQAIDMTPVKKFMDGTSLPILGEDPLHPGQRKPFSAARIEMQNEPAVLYIILNSSGYDTAFDILEGSNVVRSALRQMGLLLVLMTVLGLLLFALLTRQIRSMKETVLAFAGGDLSRRIDTSSTGEIGQLASSFNQMADTIASNVQELKQAARLRRELVGNISHDLRSPLASVHGYLETILIKSEEIDRAALKRYVDTALKNVQRLTRLVDGLFELSKLDTHQVEPTLEAFPLAELVQDVSMQYESQAADKNIQLETRIPERLPPAHADIALVERALSNLLDNAIQYTAPGDAIRLHLSEQEDHLEVCVSDTGPGIPPEDLPHIFERFYRVEKSRGRDRGGTGLGLAITKKIIDLQNGKLTVESKVGEGTTFTISLPKQR